MPYIVSGRCVVWTYKDIWFSGEVVQGMLESQWGATPSPGEGWSGSNLIPETFFICDTLNLCLASAQEFSFPFSPPFPLFFQIYRIQVWMLESGRKRGGERQERRMGKFEGGKKRNSLQTDLPLKAFWWAWEAWVLRGPQRIRGELSDRSAFLSGVGPFVWSHSQGKWGLASVRLCAQVL